MIIKMKIEIAFFVSLDRGKYTLKIFIKHHKGNVFTYYIVHILRYLIFCKLWIGI